MSLYTFNEYFVKCIAHLQVAHTLPNVWSLPSPHTFKKYWYPNYEDFWVSIHLRGTLVNVQVTFKWLIHSQIYGHYQVVIQLIKCIGHMQVAHTLSNILSLLSPHTFKQYRYLKYEDIWVPIHLRNTGIQVAHTLGHSQVTYT
jgi:hypothetical protein